jgi:hypothetical protein
MPYVKEECASRRAGTWLNNLTGQELNTMQRDPGLKAIVQIAVVCRDIEVTAGRWAAFLGVEVPAISVTGTGNECGMVYQGKPSNARCKLAFF